MTCNLLIDLYWRQFKSIDCRNLPGAATAGLFTRLGIWPSPPLHTLLCACLSPAILGHIPGTLPDPRTTRSRVSPTSGSENRASGTSRICLYTRLRTPLCPAPHPVIQCGSLPSRFRTPATSSLEWRSEIFPLAAPDTVSGHTFTPPQ